ncbi:MAG: hypothetical protein V4671_03495 [Armatimonadota bacterium]
MFDPKLNDAIAAQEKLDIKKLEAPAQKNAQKPKYRPLFGSDKAEASVKRRFTKAQRHEIAQELEKGEERAEREADTKYPEPDEVSERARTIISKKIKLMGDLEERYHKRVCRKHGISYDQMVFIIGEEANERLGW